MLRQLTDRQPAVLIVFENSKQARCAGQKLVSAVKRLAPSLPILVISERADPGGLLQALMAGARGYLLQPGSAEQVEQAVRKLRRGEAVLGSNASSLLITAFNETPRDLPGEVRLSTREQQILAYLAAGFGIKQTGPEIGVAEGTVHRYLQNLYKKLQVHSQDEALQKYFGPDFGL